MIFFLVIYFITYKKDILFYSLFLLAAAAYFFINASYTFFAVPEEIVWQSRWYDYINTPVIILVNLFYVLFLKAFFSDLTSNASVLKMFRFLLWLIPVFFALFVFLTFLGSDRQFIYYTIKLIIIVPATIVAYIILKQKLPYYRLIATGLICTIAGTALSVWMDYLYSEGIGRSIFATTYPFFFIKLGILGDMIFYLVAILKKWHAQEKQLAVEKLQSQLMVEKLRNKISRELHDDIGANLSGISMYSHIVNNLIRSGDYEQAVQSVNIIQKSAGEMTQNLNELVWTIKPEQDSFQKVFEKLEEYARSMGNVKQMTVNANLHENRIFEKLPGEVQRNIYLICKEAINNAVKYSGATLLQLSAGYQFNVVEFLIKDNGKGFNAETVKRGNGLNNMQKRAEEIEAALIVESSEKKGTAIQVIYKVTSERGRSDIR